MFFFSIGVDVFVAVHFFFSIFFDSQLCFSPLHEKLARILAHMASLTGRSCCSSSSSLPSKNNSSKRSNNSNALFFAVGMRRRSLRSPQHPPLRVAQVRFRETFEADFAADFI